MKALWQCMECWQKFEAPWTAEAYVMGRVCVKCGGTAVASERQSSEDGCLVVKDEKRIRKRLA